MLEQSKQFLKGSGQLLSPTKKAELDSKMSILEARWGRLQAELDNRYMRLVRIHEKLTNFEELLHPFLVWFVLFFKIIIIIIYYFYFYLKNCIKKWNISKKCPQFFFYLTNGPQCFNPFVVGECLSFGFNDFRFFCNQPVMLAPYQVGH